MEHRAVGICPGFDEVEHEPVFVDQAEPAERLREGGTSPRDQVFPRFAFEGGDLVGQVAAGRSLTAAAEQNAGSPELPSPDAERLIAWFHHPGKAWREPCPDAPTRPPARR